MNRRRNALVGGFVFRFGAFILLFIFLDMLDGVQAGVVAPWTDLVARVSSGLAGIFDPTVVAQGDTLISRDSGFAVRIAPGCNGIEAMGILVAAVLAFPARPGEKIAGILVGILAIQVLNFLRILSLFYFGQWNLELFEFAHLYVWPILIVLDALIAFLLWTRWMDTKVTPE